VRLSGEGEVGVNGGPPGNLYIQLALKKHLHFQRDGDNLLLGIPINYAQAALGTEVRIPTMNGGEKLKIPAGTQPGTVFRIKGKGMPSLRNHRKGDILVKVSLEVPTSLDQEQRQALEDLSERMMWNSGEDAKDKGLVGKIKDAFGSP
jgi:molecular chaperone DnaJ